MKNIYKIIFKEKWLLHIIISWEVYKKYQCQNADFHLYILKTIAHGFENWDNKFFNETISFFDEKNGVPIKPEKIQIIDNELFVNDRKVFFKADYIETHNLAFDNCVNLHYAIINYEHFFLLTKLKEEYDEDYQETIHKTITKRLSQEEYNAILDILPILNVETN